MKRKVLILFLSGILFSFATEARSNELISKVDNKQKASEVKPGVYLLLLQGKNNREVARVVITR